MSSTSLAKRGLNSSEYVELIKIFTLALEKHKEKWAEKVKKERMAKEEADLDELAQTMYLGRNKD